MAALQFPGLPEWLQSRRWFGGKGAKISEVRVVDEARLGVVEIVTFEVSYAAGRRSERYLIPLLPGAHGPMEEALDEESCRAIFEVIRGRREVPTRAGRLRGERFDGPDSPLSTLPERPKVRRLSAEQSNTPRWSSAMR